MWSSSQGLGQGLVTLSYRRYIVSIQNDPPRPNSLRAIINKFLLGTYWGALAPGILQCTVNQFGQLNTAI